MSERIFILMLGLSILVSLYFENSVMIYAVPLYLLFEGVTDIRLTHMTQTIRNVSLDDGLYLHQGKNRFTLEATRMWRLLVACVLFVAYLLVFNYHYDVLWFIPWFLGFALTGAGVSGICPGLTAMRIIGFK